MASAACADPASDQAAILKIEQDMAAAQTTQQAIASWDKNVVLDDMLALNGKTSRYIGLAAVRGDFDPQFAAITDLHTKILTLMIAGDSNIAFAFSTQHLTAKSKNGGPNLDIVFRETDCFQKKSGQWLLIHQDLSVPFDPKTGKAVFDSN